MAVSPVNLLKLLQVLLENGSQAGFHREITRDEIQIGPEIGSGAAAKVYMGLYAGREVAIKVWDSKTFPYDPDAWMEVRREVGLMSLLQHPGIVNVVGAHLDIHDAFMVSELMAGDLYTLLCKGIPPITRLSLSQKLQIAQDVAEAIAFMHSLGLIHRDLKSLNVLIGHNCEAKLVDFGTTRLVDRNSTMTGSFKLTLRCSWHG